MGFIKKGKFKGFFSDNVEEKNGVTRGDLIKFQRARAKKEIDRIEKIFKKADASKSGKKIARLAKKAM